VLVNLIANALKYAPPGTPVEVAARAEGEALLITVSDRGPGIPEADAGRVFEPFVRGTVARPYVGGAGLGLAISRRLAESQGGALRYEPREGGGSRFVLELPRVEMP
jgi:two-component system sensor histidine kinase KdpD